MTMDFPNTPPPPPVNALGYGVPDEPDTKVRIGRIPSDITGEINGDYKAIRPTDKKYQSSYVWVVQCTRCGTVTEKPISHLHRYQPRCQKCNSGHLHPKRKPSQVRKLVKERSAMAKLTSLYMTYEWEPLVREYKRLQGVLPKGTTHAEIVEIIGKATTIHH